jgi:hypothetical protein
MMKDIDLLRAAITRSQSLARQNPEVPILQSLEPQLQYLLDLLEGRQVDRTKLSKLSFGIINVREVEDRDPELSELLYQVTGLVRDIRFSPR